MPTHQWDASCDSLRYSNRLSNEFVVRTRIKSEQTIEMVVQVAVHDALAEPVDERQRERLHEPDVHAR